MSIVRSRRVWSVFACLMLLGGVLATAASAAPGLWPAKKGEVCWVAEDAGGDLSFVRAQVTNMGNDHYLFHGQAYRFGAIELQSFTGNAELNGDSIVGMITKMQLNGAWLESYTGLMTFDVATLDGGANGIVSECQVADPTVCDTFGTGVVDLWYDDDCDPATLPPELIGP